MNYVDPTKLRAYFFGNMYLSQIQQGIQAAHVVTKMFAKYGRGHEGVSALAGDTLYDWADVGVTKILLNGGYQSNLELVHKALEILCPMLQLPFSRFYEEHDALNGALTSVGVVVQEEIYTKFDTRLILPTSVKDPLTGADAETVFASMLDLRSEAEFGEEQAQRHLYFLLKSARLA